MRVIITVLLIFLSYSAFTQAVSSKYDKFNKDFRVESKRTTLNADLFNYLNFYIRSTGDDCFLILNGAGPRIITENSVVQLLLQDDSVIELKSTGYQTYSVTWNSWDHQYILPYTVLTELCTKKVKSIRKYNTAGYVDYEITDRYSNKFQKYMKEFSQEFNRRTVSEKF